MKIFLTGGTGFIGQPLTKELLAGDRQVTALVRDPQSYWAQLLGEMGALLSVGDVTNKESMRAGMEGADVVVHNAGHYEFGVDAGGARSMEAINVKGTENVLSLAEELAVERTVYVSTVWAYGDSGKALRDETFTRLRPVQTPYEATKTAAHDIAERYQERGLPLIIVCPNGVVGPNDHSMLGYLVRLYINKLLPPMAWSGDSLYTFVHVEDLAGGITLAVEKGGEGETYFLCGESKSMRETLEIWNKRPGALKQRLWMPPSLMSAMFWPMEPLQRAAGLPAVLSRQAVAAGASSLNYSGAKAQRELGWQCRTAEEMWLQTIDWEIAMLPQRSDESLISRIKPLETIP